MELFAITCTTCKSRLNVRDPAAIGQILACPKCGGMVMVKPPPAFREVGEQRSDLPTATEVESPALDLGRTPNNSAFDGLDELLSDAPPRVKPPPPSFTPPPAAPTTPKPRFVGGPPVHRSSTPIPKASSTPAKPVTAPTVKPVVVNTPNPASAAAAETPRKKSATSAEIPAPPAENVVPSPIDGANALPRPRPNFMLLIAASIVLGIGLALIGVCAVILLRPATQQPAQAATPAKPPPAPVKKQPPSQAATSTTASPSPASQQESQPTASLPTTSSPTEKATAPTIVSATPKNSNEDPLGLTATPATSAAPIPPPTNDALAKFDKIIGGPGDDPLARPPTAATATSTLPAAPDPTPARPIAPRPAPRDVDVAKRLNDPLLGIEVPGRPLAEFVQFISDLSTIPISLEVPFPPASPESRIELKASNSNVGKALAEALATLRLEYVISNDQLIVRRPEPVPFVPLKVEVKDLAADEQQINDLVELLQAVIEPGTWGEGESQGNISIDAGKGSLAVRHRRTVQFQVLIATEKLRAAHSPPLPFKTKLDPALFKLDSRLKQAGAKLAKTISLNFGQSTRLVDILDRLGQTAGVRILVDWHDVATAGWNPAGEATLVATNQPLADALEALLEPLDLTTRIIDVQTLQVVTPARLDGQGELEFYKIGDLITAETTPDALLAKIRAALGDESFVSGGGSGEIRFDNATKCLLAWLPQSKQWQLEALLSQWREKGK